MKGDTIGVFIYEMSGSAVLICTPALFLCKLRIENVYIYIVFRQWRIPQRGCEVKKRNINRLKRHKNYDMKKIIISLIVVLTAMTAFSQTQNSISTVSPDNDIVYRLFPTQNIWTFIKLDTRNGQMWQVQYSTKSQQIEVPLSLKTRVSKEEEKNGRFFLYPTQNMYNFILLDQLDGRVWQVQWSINEKERLVIPIY